jgi:hypothetical protein
MRFLLMLIPLLGGCCWLSKRSCFPECPKPKPPTVVKIEKPCKLPPKLVLPAVSRTPCELSGGQVLVCFDKANAGRLAKREADMKDWIRETRKRCGLKPPTSRPARSLP